MSTARFVVNKLRKTGLTVCEGTGKTGIVAELRARKGKTIIDLGADMDVIQPEEPEKGSKVVIDGGLSEEHPTDEIYGLHNIPFIPVGEILFSLKKGLATYSVTALFSFAALT